MTFLDKNGLLRLWAYIVEHLSKKVDKIDGKGLSTNDYTTDEKIKLDSIEYGATNTVVDSALNAASENPVQNKIVKAEFDAVGLEIEELNRSAVTIHGGADTITLNDIFGEPPYAIEFTDELEELSNITVAAGSDYTTYRLRNVAIVTEVPTIMNDGDIALVISQEV